MIRFVCAALAAAALSAQTPAVLENTGQPIRLPWNCGAEDIHSFGLVCPPGEPCPVYLELAGMDAAGGNIVAAGNLHSESATLFSVLLASADGGRTWREPFERIRGAGLERVQLLDVERGWVGGETLGPVPRDAFLLLTRDGGKTWERRALFGESRPGSIDWFVFDSPTHGVLWLDRSQSNQSGGRCETYVSTTGGESWSLTGTGDCVPHAPTPHAVPAGWRLRADPGTKSYRIERRDGTGWEPAASFLVRVGECRQEEAAPPAPEAEP